MNYSLVAELGNRILFLAGVLVLMLDFRSDVMGVYDFWQVLLIDICLVAIVFSVWREPRAVPYLRKLFGHGRLLWIVQALSYHAILVPWVILFLLEFKGDRSMTLGNKLILLGIVISLTSASALTFLLMARTSMRSLALPAANAVSSIEESQGEPEEGKSTMSENVSHGDGSPIISGVGGNVTINVEKTAPQWPAPEGITYTWKPISSPSSDARFAIEIVVQFQATMGKFALQVLFDKPILRGEAHASRHDMWEAFGSADTSRNPNKDRIYAVVFVDNNPPIGPSNPVIITILASEQIQPVKLERIVL